MMELQINFSTFVDGAPFFFLDRATYKYPTKLGMTKLVLRGSWGWHCCKTDRGPPCLGCPFAMYQFLSVTHMNPRDVPPIQQAGFIDSSWFITPIVFLFHFQFYLWRFISSRYHTTFLCSCFCPYYRWCRIKDPSPDEILFNAPSP